MSNISMLEILIGLAFMAVVYIGLICREIVHIRRKFFIYEKYLARFLGVFRDYETETARVDKELLDVINQLVKLEAIALDAKLPFGKSDDLPFSDMLPDLPDWPVEDTREEEDEECGV